MAPSSKTPSPAKPTSFNPREIEFLASALQCFKGGIPAAAELDMGRLCELTHLTHDTARIKWGAIKRKLLEMNAAAAREEQNNNEKPASKGGAKGKGRKKKGGQEGEVNVDEGVEEVEDDCDEDKTPVKKGERSKKSMSDEVAKVKVESEDESDRGNQDGNEEV